MTKLMAQLILDSLLRKTSGGLFSRMKNFLLKQMRFFFINIDDPLVSYDLYGMPLLLPLSHNLPFIQKRYPHYSTNVGRVAKYVHEKYPFMKFVDIGANVGDSVAYIRYYAHFPILCIEGSSEYFNLLRVNTRHCDDVYLSNSLVGRNDEELNASLVLKNGTARLSAGTSTVPVRSLDSILEDFRDFNEVKMIKIDTDGMDGLIIKGSLDLLARMHPVVFFEYDPYFLQKFGNDGMSLFKNLRSLGYEVAMVYDNFGDYMLSFSLLQHEVLEDLHLYSSGWKGARYYDICVFHQDDTDLAQHARLEEVSFFSAIGDRYGNSC